MAKKSLILCAVLLLSLSTAFPQGRGGGQGGGRGGPGQGQGTAQGQRQGSGQPGNGQTERKRIQATDQQRNQIRSCDRLADEIRKQARKMAKDSGKKLNHGQLTQQQAHIRNQIRQMEQEQDRLMNGLSADQQQAWQEQIRNMNRLRQQMNLHQQQMDDELKGNLDAKRVNERARAMEQTMNEWRNQYRVLSSQTEY